MILQAEYSLVREGNWGLSEMSFKAAGATNSQIKIKSLFFGRAFAPMLAGIWRLVKRIKAIGKGDLMAGWGGAVAQRFHN